ncbi:MAG: PRD domain-containing protein [Arachnia sp.]
MPTSRAVRILAMLEDARSVPVDELAEALGVTRRTVAAEVAALQDTMGTSASIGLDDGRYRLLIADPARYREAKAGVEGTSFNDPATRASYIVGRLFRALAPVRIEELGSEMSVGRTTVVADLERARAQVAEAELTIEGRPNVGLVLRGPELQQRLHVLRRHFAVAYPPDDRSARVADVVAEFGQDLVRDRVREWARWAIVALDRAMAAPPADFLPAKYRGLASTPAHALASRLADRLTEEFGVLLGSDERVFLTLPVAGVGARPGSADGELDALVDGMLDAVRVEMAIDLGGSDFLSEFARHLAYLINRMRYRIWVDDSGVADIREEYPVAYQMATVARRVLEERVGLPVDQAELGFLAAYFQIFLEAGERRGILAPRVTVVAGAGAVRAELVRLQLAKLLPPSTEFRLLAAREATREALAEADLVVVTGDDRVDTDSPTLHVTRVLDRRAMERQLERMQLRVPLRGAPGRAGAVLAGALDEAHFFALPPDTDYVEAVDFMTGHLEARGHVEAGFGARIREREATAGMRLDPWVAFPHAPLLTQTTVMLAVGVVPRDVTDDGVRLIVLLGVPDDGGRSEEVLVQVYDEVLRLGARRDLLDRICRLTSYEQFYYFLERNPLTERER